MIVLQKVQHIHKNDWLIKGYLMLEVIFIIFKIRAYFADNFGLQISIFNNNRMKDINV